MKIIWTNSAPDRFIELLRSGYTPNLANKYAEKILLHIEDLEKYPLKGRIVPEFNIYNLRELLYQEFRIIYKISGENIFIQTIRHTRESIPRAFE